MLDICDQNVAIRYSGLNPWNLPNNSENHCSNDIDVQDNQCFQTVLEKIACLLENWGKTDSSVSGRIVLASCVSIRNGLVVEQCLLDTFPWIHSRQLVWPHLNCFTSPGFWVLTGKIAQSFFFFFFLTLCPFHTSQILGCLRTLPLYTYSSLSLECASSPGEFLLPALSGHLDS